MPLITKIPAPYWSMYLAFAGYVSLIMMLTVSQKSTKVLYLILCIILNANLLFITSRTAIFAHFAGLFIYFFIVSKQLSVQRKVFSLVAVTGLMLLFFLSLETYLPYLHSKLTNLYGSSERLQLWNSALDVFISSPILGVGIGDASKELMSSYQRLYANDMPHGGDVHNEYLAVGVRIGLLGMLLLLSALFYSLVKGIKSKDPVLVYLTVLFLFCFLTESVLATNKGVVFFSLFLPLSLTNLTEYTSDAGKN